VANDFDNGGGILGQPAPPYNASSNLFTDWLYVVYTNLGFDYQAKDGFNLGFGVCLSLASTSIPASSDTFSFAVPYLNIGKFF
jgi:hypothetical protein